MRLLLDEMYSPAIARGLRENGHDALAVKERPELLGIDDVILLRRAHQELRVVVTDNVVDFAPIVVAFAQSGETHSGVLFTAGDTYPRSEEGIGVLLAGLSEFLGQHPGDNDLDGTYRWLPPVGD